MPPWRITFNKNDPKILPVELKAYSYLLHTELVICAFRRLCPEGTEEFECSLGDEMNAGGQDRCNPSTVTNGCGGGSVWEGVGALFLVGDFSYQGCRAACSQVYLLFGSFSIRFRMKSLAV